MNGQSYRTWIEISRSALYWNFRQFKRFFGRKALIAPVIKANAYGHDIAQIAKRLRNEPIWGFCVAYDTEANALIKQGITNKILVLSAWQKHNLPNLIRHNIRLIVWDIESAQTISDVAKRSKIAALVHMKIDTGTTRIGTRPERIELFRRQLSGLPWIVVEGIFSHYADSESGDLASARDQRDLFIRTLNGMRAPLIHMACTAASLRLPITPTNLVRLGIGLYGLWPSKATRKHVRSLTLRPVMSWYTRILQVKRVPRGTTIGYARTFRVRRPTTIAVLPVGYADGYDRKASNRGFVVIRGGRSPIVGRVSMNLMAADLGATSAARPGDVVTLIGKGVSAEDCAAAWDTINYETVSRIDRDIPRIGVP